MARKRMIDPGIWTDDAVLELGELGARFLLLHLISIADDKGRFRAHPRTFVLQAFGFLSEPPSVQDVERWMQQVAEVGIVTLYRSAGKLYGHFPNWTRHQKVNRPSPSRLPEPTPALSEPSCEAETPAPTLSDPSVTAHVVLSESSVSPPDTLSEGRVPKEGKGKERNTSGGTRAAGVEQEPEKRPKKRRGDPRVGQVRAAFIDAYMARHGGSKPIWGPAQGKLTKTALKSVDVEELCALMVEAVNAPDGHWLAGKGAKTYLSAEGVEALRKLRRETEPPF